MSESGGNPPSATIVVACSIDTPKSSADVRPSEIELRPDEMEEQLSRVASNMDMADPTFAFDLETDRSSTDDPVYGWDTMDTMVTDEPVRALERAFERVHQLPANGYVFVRERL